MNSGNLFDLIPAQLQELHIAMVNRHGLQLHPAVHHGQLSGVADASKFLHKVAE